MARPASADLVPALPVLRWFDAGRTTPLRLGVGITLVLLGLRIASIAVFGSLRLPISGEASPLDLREARIGLVLALCLGYVPAAYGWAVRSLRGSLEALRPVFGVNARVLDDTAAQAGHLTRSARRRWLAAGLVFALFTPVLVDRDPRLYLEPAYWRPETILNWLELPLVGCLLTLTLRSFWEDAQRLSRVAASLPRVDLLDAKALAPFGRQALRVALLTVGLASLFSILVSDRGFAEVVGILALSAAAIATTAFLLPVRGIHGRIVREKADELVRVRAALRGDTAPFGGSVVSAWRQGATLGDLLAYEARIEAVREWPFDVPTLFRFAAFLLLPLGSWLGGALVERIVSRLLG
jgi:hypothetical protein